MSALLEEHGAYIQEETLSRITVPKGAVDLEKKVSLGEVTVVFGLWQGG